MELPLYIAVLLYRFGEWVGSLVFAHFIAKYGRFVEWLGQLLPGILMFLPMCRPGSSQLRTPVLKRC